MIQGQDYQQLRKVEYLSKEKWLKEGRTLHDQTLGDFLAWCFCRFVELLGRKQKKHLGSLEGIGHSA